MWSQNKMYLNSLLLFCAMIIGQNIMAQSAHKLLREGDKAYKTEQYAKAEESYRKALEKKAISKSYFNLGNTVYQQDRFEEAAQQYDASAAKASNDIQKAEALYNKGNAELKGGKLEEAIEAYKSALNVNPNDQDALKNLYLSKLMKKQQEQQQQQQQQDQQQQENQENQDQQQPQNQENQDQQQRSENAEPSVDNQNESQAEQQENQEMSKADAEKLLKVIENEDKNVQEKLRKVAGDKKKPKKDW